MYGIRLGFNLWEFSIVNRKTLHYLNCVKWSRQLNSFWVNGLLCIFKEISWLGQPDFTLQIQITSFGISVWFAGWQPDSGSQSCESSLKKSNQSDCFPSQEGKWSHWLSHLFCFSLCNIVQRCATLCNNIAFVNF